MKRRRFLAGAVAVVAGLFGFKPADAAPTNLRRVWRAEPRKGITFWRRIRMFEARKGDRLLLEDFDGEWVATSDPWQRDGSWGISAEGPCGIGGLYLALGQDEPINCEVVSA